MIEHSDTTQSGGGPNVDRGWDGRLDAPSVDVGRRDPDYPYRSVLPWRSRQKVENYTICCPRCGSYRLSNLDMFDVGRGHSLQLRFRCDECHSSSGISIHPTRHGAMLATD